MCNPTILLWCVYLSLSQLFSTLVTLTAALIPTATAQNRSNWTVFTTAWESDLPSLYRQVTFDIHYLVCVKWKKSLTEWYCLVWLYCLISPYRRQLGRFLDLENWCWLLWKGREENEELMFFRCIVQMVVMVIEQYAFRNTEQRSEWLESYLLYLF